MAACLVSKSLGSEAGNRMIAQSLNTLKIARFPLNGNCMQAVKLVNSVRVRLGLGKLFGDLALEQ